MPIIHEIERKYNRIVCRTGGFFKGLSFKARWDFESLVTIENYVSMEALFEENEMPSSIFFLLEGRVKLRMDSASGKRLTLRIAKPGELLGLTSGLSCTPYETTAEALCACQAASMRCEDFRGFLMRHPAAYEGVVLDLSREYNRTCDRLRTVALAARAPIKLARLLLEWSANGQETEHGTRICLSFSHAQIGEFIGASRETVSRTLKDFRRLQLIDQHDLTLTIPNRRALECYAELQTSMIEQMFPRPEPLLPLRTSISENCNSIRFGMTATGR